MDIVCDVVPAKRIKSCGNYSSLNDTLPVYNLKYEERDLQEIVVDTEISIYVSKTLIIPFNLHCLLCNKTCCDERSIFSHLNSSKHLAQNLKKREAIGIISKEFNTFILCCLSDLIAFVHVYYKTHGLNEIVVANKEFIFSENTKHFSDGSEANNKIVVSSPRFVSPVVENSVYFRTVVDREDSQLYYESRAARYSHLTGNIVIETKGSCSPKIAYIYELFDKGIPSSEPIFVDILEWCSENIPLSTIVWCSLCSKCITIQCLPYHIKEEHVAYCRFLYGLMCHKCETLFLIVYGDKMHHVHTRGATNKILRNQLNKKFSAVHLMPDVSLEAIEIYMSDFQRRYSLKKSNLKFECLLCFSPLVKSFAEFKDHLRDSSHLDKVVHENRKFTAFCDACNIILISQNVNRLFDHFEVHELSLNVIRDIEDSVMMATSDVSAIMETDSDYCAQSTIIYPKVANFSESAFQFTNPGVQDDFTITKDMTIENIEEYIDETFYSIYSDLKKIYFSCLNCTSARMDKTSFFNHLKNRKHLMKVRPYSDLIFFVKICDICQIFLLGSHIELVKKHFTSADHNHNVKCRMAFIRRQYAENSGQVKLGWSGKLTERSIELFSSKEGLNNHIELCLKEAEEISKSASFVHGMLERDIRNTLEPNCDHIDIKFFGSRMYGLARQDSDVDVFITGVTIEDLEQGFSKSMSLFNVKEIIKEAKVPIIKVEHIYTSLDCDINCCDCGAAYNTELVKLYIALDPRVQWLLMAVKEWASINYIRGCQKFTSYGLIWLVLFFLMQPDICLVPPVKLLKNLHEGPKTLINGWNYSFTSDIETIKVHHNPLACEKTKYELLIHFFQYYAMLKAKRVVLYPLTGEVYPRSVIANTDICICPELSMNTEDTEPVRIGGQFVLLDCFRLRYNMLKNVEENLADHFKLICAKMYENTSSSWKS
ncbi:uncharacterized protein [Halyomorpha halys]|uniref:uncharacterized protein n=1 Tax=Halyomorpha halys TaxID=286706 RepID=UPI0006D4FCFD|nr:uncharacterized protein LOC106684172 [Halyomorpha halys]